MRPVLEMRTPAEVVYCPVFMDSADVAAAYLAHEIKIGDKILYRGMICDIIGESPDVVTGEPVALMVVCAETPGMSFNIHMG